MRSTIRALLLAEAVRLAAAAALHSGAVTGGPFQQAAFYERAIAGVLAVGLGVAYLRPGWTRPIAPWERRSSRCSARSSACTGRWSDSARTPRPTIVYHFALIGLLAWGTVVADRRGGFGRAARRRSADSLRAGPLEAEDPVETQANARSQHGTRPGASSPAGTRHRRLTVNLWLSSPRPRAGRVGARVSQGQTAELLVVSRLRAALPSDYRLFLMARAEAADPSNRIELPDPINGQGPRGVPLFQHKQSWSQ